MRFGNAFNCHATIKKSLICGESDQCKKCKIRNLLKLRHFTTQFKYKQNNKFQYKWLEFNIKIISECQVDIAIITINDISKFIF